MEKFDINKWIADNKLYIDKDPGRLFIDFNNLLTLTADFLEKKFGDYNVDQLLSVVRILADNNMLRSSYKSGLTVKPELTTYELSEDIKNSLKIDAEKLYNVK